jgi:hypothetical protein
MNPIQRKKQNLRRHDRNWKADKFPKSFGDQFQLHHDWAHGAVVYFLTPEEHIIQTEMGV